MEKQPLYFIPGLLCDERVFTSQKNDLQANFDCQSIALQDTHSLDACIDSIASQIAKSSIIVGHSLGGYLALKLAISYPALCQRLIILASNAMPYSTKEKKRRSQELHLFKQGKIDEVIQRLSHTFVYNKKALTLTKKILLTNQDQFKQQIQLLLERPNLLPLLKTIACPCLVIVGDKDSLFYSHSKEMAKNIPNTQLHTIANTGHMLTLESPEVTTQCIKNWLLSKH